MAWMDDFSPRDLALGVAIGIGAAALFPELAPAIRGAGRPLLKSALKAALAASESGRDRIAELQETIEDLVAEVRHELASEPETAADASATQA